MEELKPAGMANIDTVKQVFSLIETDKLSEVGALLSDNFTFSGPMPEAVNSDQWLGLHGKLNVAFPNWKFNLSNVNESEGKVTAVAQITGKNDGQLDLSPIGFPVFDATGKNVSLPQENITVTFDGNKITSIVGEKVEGGGVVGIVSQLGFEIPRKE